MSLWLEIVISFFLITAASFALIGSLGLARLPDFFMRTHAPTKGSTLGVGGVLIASMIYFTALHGRLSITELMITVFVFISAPISAHLMGRTALHLKIKTIAKTGNKPYDDA